MASKLLLKHGHELVLVGIKQGDIDHNTIINNKEINFNEIDTITLYIGPQHQEEWYDYIIQIKPKRVIFNPGTENQDLQQLLQQHHITYEEACTLVLLNTGQY
jgi:predicted CoA-binding protein